MLKLGLLLLFFQGAHSSSYSHHWWGALPASKKLLIHDIFIISFDPDKQLAEWTAYRLSPSVVWGELKSERKYKTDPLFPESLSYKDYAGASDCDKKVKRGYDKGHLAPLGSFKGSLFSYQAQYLTNIAPQKRDLNQGAWQRLESYIRSFVKTGKEVKILTGPLYEKSIAPCWKQAQGKLTQIPSHYWKLVSFKKKSYIHTCSVIMPQEARRTDLPKKFVRSLEELSKKTKLSFFEKKKAFKIKPSCDFLW